MKKMHLFILGLVILTNAYSLEVYSLDDRYELILYDDGMFSFEIPDCKPISISNGKYQIIGSEIFFSISNDIIESTELMKELKNRCIAYFHSNFKLNIIDRRINFNGHDIAIKGLALADNSKNIFVSAIDYPQLKWPYYNSMLLGYSKIHYYDDDGIAKDWRLIKNLSILDRMLLETLEKTDIEIVNIGYSLEKNKKTEIVFIGEYITNHFLPIYLEIEEKS